MKNILLLIFLSFFVVSVSAQYEYEPSMQNPFGKLNPAAYLQTTDFEPLIGVSECISESRAADGSWNSEVNMLWKWKYIMNGMAVQDETLKEDGLHSGSIRQFNADSSKWYVHYYASASASPALPVWEGSKVEENKIVLYRRQAAPNGTDGYYRLTFYEITDENFNWVGEWVDLGETFSYPTWKISCIKQK
jgi:hypothetical protein